MKEGEALNLRLGAVLYYEFSTSPGCHGYTKASDTWTLSIGCRRHRQLIQILCMSFSMNRRGWKYDVRIQQGPGRLKLY